MVEMISSPCYKNGGEFVCPDLVECVNGVWIGRRCRESIFHRWVSQPSPFVSSFFGVHGVELVFNEKR